MKKTLRYIIILTSITITLSGCSSIGDKSASISVIYGSAAILSLLLLIGCCFLVRKSRTWFHLLFSSVLVVNVGYTLLSVSSSLDMALWANRLSYLGAVFLPLSMLLILLNVTGVQYAKHLPKILFAIATAIFLIAASPGILDIYYKEVSFEIQNGVSTLVKVYGPLHPIYFIYLLGYFSSMVFIIIRGMIKKTIQSTSHAVILTIAVFVNIGVWLIEQLSDIDFEMLSISYIISELFLLAIHLAMNENQRLRELVKQVESVRELPETKKESANTMLQSPLSKEQTDDFGFDIFINGVKQLTPTEKKIYDAYIARVTTKEIMANLNITENTLKYHNKNIYGKLGVSSRKELLEIYKQIQAVKKQLEHTTN